jgi:hypothetical protein
MSDSIPNCAVTLHFYEDSARFSYICTNSSRGWQVLSDGSIHPPSKSRIVQIGLRGFPNTDIKFAGLQLTSTDIFQGANWTPTSEHDRLGVVVSTPDGYPPPNQTTAGPLTLNFTGLESNTRLFYRLAVAGSDGILHWDDPKIYDDGSE